MKYYTPQEEIELRVINNLKDEERKEQITLFAEKTNRNFDAVNSKLHYMNNKTKKKTNKTIVKKFTENRIENTLRIPVDNFKMFIENGFVIINF